MPSDALTWTVNEVLEHIAELGIPHFQRGLVWGVDSRSALLESLFYDTPCGSLVLWVPKECSARGVPLDPALRTAMKYLVIDGQQRIRSLHSVFNHRAESDEDDEADGQDDAPGDGRRVWCINLTRVPWFAPHLKAPAREYSLFVRTLDPVARKAAQQPSPLINNMLPLDRVLEAESWASPALASYRDLVQWDKRDERLTDTEREALYQRLHATALEMKHRPFFVSVQHRDDPAEMADLYNRINAGGKRVEVEERAFARLVGLQPTTYEELARLFEAVHPEAALLSERRNRERQGRDEVLERQKERAFGFKLFIRVFLQVCQHHLGFRQGKSDFSFDLASKGYFLAAYRQLTAEQSSWLWAETSRVLEHARGLLREELACDDLRSLPDTAALTPVFQLLIHYPGLGDKQYRPLLAGLCLRLLLADFDSRTLLKLLHDASDPHRVAFDVIPEMLRQLERATDKAKLGARLEQANSIQHRYVLLLYWLERHMGARDFLYANVPTPNKLKPPETRVSYVAEPEKQHLLPFNKAQGLYSGELRRGGSHLANSLGNLTYISRALNDFDGGLGDNFANLAAEPSENLRAHLMTGEQSGQRVLADYEKLRNRLADNKTAPTAKDREVFERMIRQRREVVGEAFAKWVGEIDAESCKALRISSLMELASLARADERLEPASPKFAPLHTQNAAHDIRRLGLSHRDEDRVVYLAKHAARISTRKDDKPYRDLLFTKKRKRLWVAVSPGHVALIFASDVLQEHRQEILEALGLEDEGETIPDAIPLKPVPDFQPLLELMKVLGPELEGKSDTSAGRWEQRGRFWAGFAAFLRHRPDAAFQLENPLKKGATRLFLLSESSVLKGKISVARGNIETYLRLKGEGSAQIFDALQRQREEIEKAVGAELRWQVKVKDENYQVGVELDSAGTEDDRAEQFEWLHETAKRFIEVFGPRLKAST